MFLRRALRPLLPVSLAFVLAVVVAGAFAAACPAPARAQEGPASPARYLPPVGWRPKEFTVVRRDGWFHIFYIRENLIPGAPTQRSFGHAVSRDLYTWIEQDTILAVVPDTFEETQVWAPTVHRVGDLYHLYYAGMRDRPSLGYHLAQSISVATSSDLYDWTRRGSPLFDNAIFPWSHYDTTVTQGRDCRDPFLWWDESRGEWLMFVATRPAVRPQSMVIGIAGSTDLEQWQDRGYVPITLPEYTFSDVAESPHVMTRDDSLLLLLWTTNSGQSLTFGRSTDAATGWNTSRRLRNMLGYSTVGWWGSEAFADGGRRYFGSLHDIWVNFWDLTWVAPDTFRVDPPDSLQLLDARFDRAAAAPGDTVMLEVDAVHGAGREVSLEFVRADLPQQPPLAPATLALPDPVTLAGDHTVVPWLVPWPEDGQAMRVGVRVPGAGGPGGALDIVLPPPAYRDEPPPPEPPLVRVVTGRRGEVRFVRARAPLGYSVRVFDARGREVWRASAAPGQRTVVWRTTPAAGVAGAAPPGIYFARIDAPGEPRPARVKVPLLPAAP